MRAAVIAGNLRALYLNPLTGRFNALDSFKGDNSDPQSLHKYAYASLDPITGVDPSGQFTVVEILVVALAFIIIAATLLPSFIKRLPEDKSVRCIPWVTNWASNPDHDLDVNNTVKALENTIGGIGKFEKLLSLAAIATFNQALGMEEAIAYAIEEKVGSTLESLFTVDADSFARSMVDSVQSLHGDIGGWNAWTKMRWGAKPAEQGKWIKLRTGGPVDGRGIFSSQEDAWKAAAEECGRRLEAKEYY